MEKWHRRLPQMLIAQNGQVFVLFVDYLWIRNANGHKTQDTTGMDGLFCSCWLESLWEALKAEV